MLINEVLKEYLNEFVTVYIDNILIYSNSFEEYMIYLEYIIERNSLRPDKAKIEKIKNILRLIKIKELRTVLRLFNYYKKFVKGYLKIVNPLYKLLRKEKKYIWKKKQEKTFNRLKKKLIEVSIL